MKKVDLKIETESVGNTNEVSTPPLTVKDKTLPQQTHEQYQKVIPSIDIDSIKKGHGKRKPVKEPEKKPIPPAPKPVVGKKDTMEVESVRFSSEAQVPTEQSQPQDPKKIIENAKMGITKKRNIPQPKVIKISQNDAEKA